MTAELPPGGSADDVLMTRILAFVADAADVPLDRVGPDSDLFGEIGVDSLGLVLILVNLKDEFGVDEPEEEQEWALLATPRAIHAMALTSIAQGRGA